MPAAPITLDDASLILGQTSGLTEIVYPFEGGNHEFRFTEEPGEGGVPITRVLLDLEDDTFEIGQEAFRSAMKKVPGGGDSMVSKWPLRMVMEPLNYFFDNKPGDFKLLAQGNQAMCFTKAKSVLFNPVDVLDVMATAVGRHGGKSQVVVENLVHSLEETMFTVRVPDDHVSFVEARPGDRTLGGLAFSGSLLGYKESQLDLFTHRVRCRNGMISPEGTTRFKVGEEEDDGANDLDRLREWLTTNCASLFDGDALVHEFGRIRHLTEEELTTAQTGRVLEFLGDRFSLSASMRADVDEALGEEMDGTMYGVVQSFTRAAQHSPSLTDTQRYRLMRTAGVATYDVQSICDSCRRPIA